MADAAAQFILDMDADDFIKRGLGLEAQLQRPAGIESARPARHDPATTGSGTRRMRFTAASPGDAAQRLDLFPDRR